MRLQERNEYKSGIPAPETETAVSIGNYEETAKRGDIVVIWK